jgi:SAM-dependent methyltransferase
MEYTGERPFNEEGLYSSRIRYKALAPYCVGKRVLDFGCGIGYGSYYLGEFALSVLGYDVSVEAIDLARRSLSRGNVKYTSTLDEATSFSFDTMVSVECIEHLEREDLKKLLSAYRDKTWVCTTPNGDMFPYHPATVAERRGFHLWHYTYTELVSLFSDYFLFVEVTGCAFDPRLAQFTGYSVFASNELQGNPLWMTRVMGP